MSKILNEIEKETCVGLICKSKNSGYFKIISYKNAYHVEVEFLKTGYKSYFRFGDIKNGNVKDPYHPSIYNIGITGVKYGVTYKDESGKSRKFCEYKTWHSMLTRCYSDKFLLNNPTYKGCSVSENFKSYTYFYEWCQDQIGFRNEGWHLDKDLLMKGNKVYSEDICVFLPLELNSLLNNHGCKRGDCPIGVCTSKNTSSYFSYLQKGGSQQYLGAFKTPEEAFYVYKQAKEDFIKEKASKWKDKIDPRAFEALMNYEVDIDD